MTELVLKHDRTVSAQTELAGRNRGGAAISGADTRRGSDF
jgi:hypothetical protein